MATEWILDVELNQTWGRHDVTVLRIEYNRAFAMKTIKPWADNATIEIAVGAQAADAQHLVRIRQPP